MFLAAISGSLLIASGAVSDVSVRGGASQAWLAGYADFYPAQVVTGTATLAVTSTAPLTTTATVEVTATATLTTPLAQPTPVPIESPGASLQWNPFDWQFLTGRPDPPLGPFAYVALALMLGALGVGIYFYFVKRPEWKRTNSVRYRAANRFAQPAIWLGVVGLLLILARVVQFDFFNLRFWLYLWLLALVGVAVWFFLWYRNSYPKEMAKFTKVQRQKQYMTGSGKVSSRQSKAVPQPRRSAPFSTPTPLTPATSGEKPAQPQGRKRRKRR